MRLLGTPSCGAELAVPSGVRGRLVPAAFRREVAVLLFELFPWFYLVSGFTLVAGVTATALFIADCRARREERERVTA